MIKEHYSILFCSLTGNTKKLADAIYETLPKDISSFFMMIQSFQVLRRVYQKKIEDNRYG